MKRQYTPTERAGINAVERIVLRLGWIFREQPVADFGIDAHVEICDHGKPTGRLIALQIRSGESYFKEHSADGFVYRGSKEHLEYWMGHSLPVVLVLYDPRFDAAWWCVIAPQNVKQTPNGWRVTVPGNQRLDYRSRAPLSLLAIPNFTRKKLPTDWASQFTSSNSRATLSSLLDALSAAECEIDVASPFIDDKIFWALSAMSHRAVHVRLLTGPHFPETLPGAAHSLVNAHLDWRTVINLHAKLVAIDRRLVIESSANFTLFAWQHPAERVCAQADTKATAGKCAFFDEIWKTGDTVVANHFNRV